MKFTLELPVLTRMVTQVSQKLPGQKRSNRTLRLYACAARVFVESNQTVAGMEALVLEDGACTLPTKVFLGLLKTYAPRRHITIEADERSVRFGSTTLDSADYSPIAIPPAQFLVFPVTDARTATSSQRTVAPLPERSELDRGPAPGPPATAPCEEFEDVNQLVPGIARRLLAIDSASPQQIVGLTRAIYSLERLPQITAGVDVTYSVAVRTELGTRAYSVQDYSVHISERWFQVESGNFGAAPGEAGEHFTCKIHEEHAQGQTFTLNLSEDQWVDLLRWVDDVNELLEGIPSDRLHLDVKDESNPDCMPRWPR